MKNKNIEDFYPLSPMQQGMLFHSLYDPGSEVYLEQLSCLLRGVLDVAAFERAWQRVMDRHTILRSAFVGESLKEPVQVVHRRLPLPLEQHDWRGLDAGEQQARVEALLAGERRRGFTLAQPPLLRLVLLRLATDCYRFVWTYHHALLDGWSGPLLLHEVFTIYEAFARGEQPDLPAPRPYRDYIAWLKRQDLAAAEAFWRTELRGFSAPTPLPLEQAGALDASDSPVNDQAAEQEIRLSVELSTRLQTLARQHQLTLNTLIQGAWALLLSRYSGEEDVLFGATVAGRPPELGDVETMVGLFINTLPVRIQVPAAVCLADWLAQLQRRQTELRQFEYTPLVQIQGWSEVARGQLLFESIVVFESYPVDQALGQQSGSIAIEDIRSFERTNYPLTVVAAPGPELELKIAYSRERFTDPQITRMLGHLHTLLAGFAAGLDQPLAALPLLTAAEHQQIVYDWNATAAPFPADHTVHQLFEQQAACRPDAVAVRIGAAGLTYAELNRRANQLAHHLRRQGVGPDSLVAICAERSLDMIVAILGVLKAGAAYVPLDPSYPHERLRFMLHDTEAVLLISDGRVAATVAALLAATPQSGATAIQLIDLANDWPLIGAEPDTNPAALAGADNLAYVIYTSGSTGRPKGTLLEHRGLCNLAAAYSGTSLITADDRVLQFFAFGFDGSVLDIFVALLAGATLCLVPPDLVLPGPDLAQYMREQAITVAMLPPPVLAVLPDDELPALRCLFSGGEACTPDIVARWAPGRLFYNGYGPTEATVAVSWYRASLPLTGTSIPIGRPIANTRLYILDHHGQPAPVGVPGELHIGGVGLARGYLQQPELTREKFMLDPFADQPGTRLYKTGDLVRYLPDGNIEFLGRIDHQVKLRGFRIELGEIESVLRQHPALRQAVVLVREDVPGDRRLVAYIVATEAVEPAELRAFLRARLPEYMLPAAFVCLETLPLTPNGKVDRKALPAPEGGALEDTRSFVAARDPLEQQLAQLFAEILGLKQVGISDDFFELGGHSLLAVRLIALIQQQVGIALPLLTLFQGRTVERLASALRQHQQRPSSELATALVPIQAEGSRRPLFFVHPSGGSVHWYADLARHLGPDQPFYGLQARGLDGDAEPHERIEEMATHYIEALRTIQPEGPYLLGSWSLGVIIAFEMAQQLQQAGQELALLALIDQGPFIVGAEPEDDVDFLLAVFDGQLTLDATYLRRLDPNERLDQVMREARKHDMLPPDISLTQFRRFVGLLRAQNEAWGRYEPRPYPGQITVFRAAGHGQSAALAQEHAATAGAGQRRWAGATSIARVLSAWVRPQRHQGQQQDEQAAAPDLGWAQLALGGVEVYELPGDHRSIVHEPDVRHLAARLRACLEDSRTEVTWHVPTVS